MQIPSESCPLSAVSNLSTWQLLQAPLFEYYPGLQEVLVYKLQTKFPLASLLAKYPVIQTQILFWFIENGINEQSVLLARQLALLAVYPGAHYKQTSALDTKLQFRQFGSLQATHLSTSVAVAAFKK